MPYQPIKGFAPDADPSEPGVLTDCNALLPTLNGVKTIPSNVDSDFSVIASTAASGASVTKLDGTNEIYVATKGKTSTIYKLTSTTWTNFKNGGGTYSANSAAQWTFAQYGDIILAAQKGDKIQRTSTATASFTSMSVSSGMFKARIVETVLDFAVAFNIDDSDLTGPIYGDAPDRWLCSAAGNVSDWTTSIATQSTSGRLTDYPGEITAAKRLGSNLVAYKQQSMFLGQYVGVPEVWRFRAIPGDGLGTWGPFSVVSIETAHLFWGFDNAYLYDGTRPIPIGTNRVAKWFFENLNIAEADKMIGYHDRQEFRVIWYFPSGADATLDRYVAYNYRSDRWAQGGGGGFPLDVQAVFEYRPTSVTYDGLNTLYAATAYDDLPASSYDDWVPTTGTPVWAVVEDTFGSNRLRFVNGNPGIGRLTTWNIGTDDKITVVDRIRPRFKTAPTIGLQQYIYSDVHGGDETTLNGIASLFRGGFDRVHAARWQKFKQEYVGEMELLGIDYRAQIDSEE